MGPGRKNVVGRPRRFPSLFAFLAFLVVPAGDVALPVMGAPGDVGDSPDAERRLTDLPPGFELQLVASEPEVVNPVAMNFDPEGRLWVACAPRYPQLLPGQAPADYVVVLDDFDASGKAHSARVFCDKLTIPTGLAPGDGGVYVGQGDSLLHFRDTRGVGKADERRVLLTGFGTQDTHHTLNTFRWGPDGALYFNQGVYVKSTVETPYGPRRLFGGGVWQLRTDRLRLEVFDRSILDNNTWGHVFDPWGQSFLSSAWPDGINRVLPEPTLPGGDDRDLIPPLPITRVGGGRHCGLEIVSGRHFPDDFQGDLLTGDFLTHRVQRYRLRNEGGQFAATPLPPLAASRHTKFRPVDVKMGPDGAVYVADLFQEIIQHNQINFRDPRRDHRHGRVWRIIRKDRPLLPRPKLVGVPVAAVLDQLKAPEQWTRTQARRALSGRSRGEVAVTLAAWAARLDVCDPNLQHHLLEALWTYQSVDEVDRPLLTRLLRGDDPRIRAAATRVLGAWAERVGDATTLVAELAADPDPRVRLEAVQVAGRIPSAAAASAAVRALEMPSDPPLEFALRRSLAVLKPYWYPEFRAGRLTFAGQARALSFAVQAARVPDAVPHLTELLRAGKVSREGRADVLSLLAALGRAAEQDLVLEDVLAADRLGGAERVRVLAALRQASGGRPARPDNDPSRISALFGQENAEVSAQALRLAGTWKLEKLRGEITRIAAGSLEGPRRQAAVAALVDLGGADSVRQLEELAGGGRAFNARAEALAGLAALDVRKAARLAAPLLRKPIAADEKPADLIAVFLHRAGGQAALAAALLDSPPSEDAARAGMRTVHGLGVPAPELLAVFQKVVGGTRPARKLDAAALHRLTTLVRTQGDPARGEAVFRRSDLGCLQCHAVAGAGGRVGPDLATVGASAPVDYLLESVVLPGKVVKDGYATAHVVTRDGRAFSGVVLRESHRELVLRDPTHDEIVIPVGEVEERRSGGSLMPEGLDQGLTDSELADLVRFLSELGRPGPYASSDAPVARRWESLADPPPALLALDDEALGKALRDDARLTWVPAYALASGHLPLSETGQAKEGPVLRCRIEAAVPGKVLLLLNDAKGLRLWVDGLPVTAGRRIPVSLSRGTHTIVVRVHSDRRKETRLRFELAVPPGSPAQASFAAGK